VVANDSDARADKASRWAAEQAFAQQTQVGLREILFDEWKELMLLEAHVRGQYLSERMQRGNRSIRCEPVGRAADAKMIDQDPEDHRMFRVRMAGKARQEHFLLKAEVLPLLYVPDGEERRDRLRGGIRCRSPQTLGHREGVLVAT
jgi:hypothetical protein